MEYPEAYFVNILGEHKGPYTFPQIKRLYDNKLIPRDTLYWMDGMEDELHAVADLCDQRQNKLRHLKQLRVAGVALLATVTLVLAYCAPVLKDGWREMNDRDQTQEGAYWRARGYVREEVKQQDANVAFSNFAATAVTLTGTQATVVLPGTMYDKEGKVSKMAWKVVMNYDEGKSDWRLPAR